MNQLDNVLEQVSKPKPHLLVLDDEIEVAKSIRRQFRGSYQVHIATDAAEAIRILNEWPIQVAISDQRMPGLTGVEFFSQIKQTHPNTIRLLLTGYTDIDAVIAGVNDGSIFRYIKKPWDRSELDSVLEDAYQHHALIAANKRLLNDLRQSEQRYRALFENSPVALMELDFSAVRLDIDELALSDDVTLGLYWDKFPQAKDDILTQINVSDLNLAARRLLQLKDEIDTDGKLAHLSEVNFGPFLRAAIAAFHSGARVHQEDVTLRISVDRTSYALARALVMPDNQESWAHIVVGLADITERKEAEAATQQALKHERALNNIRSGIIDTISHEFRTPLTVIQSSGHALVNYIDQLSPERRQKHAENIAASTQRLVALLDDISMFAKLETGSIQVNPAPTDLHVLCEELIADVVANQSAIPKINLTIDGDCTRISMDVDIVSIIMRHLLENAIKFTLADGVIDLALRCNGTQATICVTDQGIGISSSEQDNMFDIFAQVGNKGTARGIGIGLALVKRLVELHGGVISVLSEENEGTRICVSLT